MAWFVWLLVGLVLNVVAYLLMPRPKSADQPQAVKDMERPTAIAGRPKPVVFGMVEVAGTNLLDTRDRNKHTYEVNA